MRLALCMALLFILSGSAHANSERFALPTDKSHLDDCRKKALRFHPETIERIDLLKSKQHDFLMRYEIGFNHTPMWLVLCDLASGNIVGDQQLLTEK